MIAAGLGFAAFALLFRERERGAARLGLVGAAGLAAGLAVSFEYPLGLVGAILFVYALGGPGGRLARGATYLGGAIAGAAPALLYNWWSLGSPLRFAYSDAVAVPGYTGHDELGLNDDGLFGITLPRPESAFDLLFASRGLLALTPVIAMARRRRVLHAPQGSRHRGARDRRDRRRVLHLQRGLLDPVRRRDPRAALLHSRAALPRARTGVRLPANAGADDRARDPVGDPHDRWNVDVPADRRARRRRAGRPLAHRRARAHRAHGRSG